MRENNTDSCQIVGVNEFEISESGLVSYPNPTSGNLTIQFKSLNNEKYKVSVFNSYGSFIDQYSLRGILGDNKLELNTDIFPAGMYYIEIISEDEKITGKFIKL